MANRVNWEAAGVNLLSKTTNVAECCGESVSMFFLQQTFSGSNGMRLFKARFSVRCTSSKLSPKDTKALWFGDETALYSGQDSQSLFYPLKSNCLAALFFGKPFNTAHTDRSKRWPGGCGVDFKKVLNFNIKNHSIPRHDCGIDHHYQTGRIWCFFFALFYRFGIKNPFLNNPSWWNAVEEDEEGSNDSSEMYL